MTKQIDDADASQLVTALTSALQRRDRKRIVDTLVQLLRGRARLGARWQGFAEVLFHTGEFDLAEMALSLLIAQSSRRDEASFAAAVLLANMGRVDKAERLVAALPAGTLHRGVREHFLATAAAELGRGEEAEQYFRAALAANPSHGQIWHGFAVGHRFTLDDPMFAAIERLGAASAHEANVEWALLQFALGKARSDVGRTDTAFAAFAAGADMLARLQPSDSAADAADADATVRAWTPEAFAAAPQAATTGQPPILVFGAPRSGTTLIEQILSSHSAVAGGGENDAMRHIVNMTGGTTPADLDSYVARGGNIDDLRALHLHLLATRFGRDGLLIDKALGSRHLGLMARLFTDAPIVWIRRDPLDTAWSIFRTYFADGQDWSWTQPGIARHLAAEDRLFAHWCALLGSRILVIDYHALVSEPARVVPELLTRCGLTFEPATITPERTTRAVRTASVTQVRAPINTDAIGSARPFRAHLQPFVDAYIAAGGTID